MPCGGIYPIQSDTSTARHGSNVCYVCNLGGSELWIEEWDSALHRACLPAFLASDDGRMVLWHGHEIDVPSCHQAADVPVPAPSPSPSRLVCGHVLIGFTANGNDRTICCAACGTVWSHHSAARQITFQSYVRTRDLPLDVAPSLEFALRLQGEIATLRERLAEAEIALARKDSHG